MTRGIVLFSAVTVAVILVTIFTWLELLALTFIKPPICLFGYVHGLVRWEKPQYGDIYTNNKHLFVFQSPQNGFAITHLQKKSRFGFLVMWPLCFYFWFQLRFQKQEIVQNVYGPYLKWMPRTERGTYPRLGYRWDAGMDKYFLSFYPPWFWHMD